MKEVTNKPMEYWKARGRLVQPGLEALRLTREFLADFKDEKDPHFNMWRWFRASGGRIVIDPDPRECGSAACALGWMTQLFPDRVSFFRSGRKYTVILPNLAGHADLETLHSNADAAALLWGLAGYYKAALTTVIIEPLAYGDSFSTIFEEMDCVPPWDKRTCQLCVDDCGPSLPHVVAHIDLVLKFMESK